MSKKWYEACRALNGEIALKLRLIGYSLREERLHRRKAWVLYDDATGDAVRNDYGERYPYPKLAGSTEMRKHNSFVEACIYVLLNTPEHAEFLLSGEAMGLSVNVNEVEMTYRTMFELIVLGRGGSVTTP